MTPEQRLHWKILHRHKDGVEADIDSLVPYPLPIGEKLEDEGKRGRKPCWQLTSHNVLLPAMNYPLRQQPSFTGLKKFILASGF